MAALAAGALLAWASGPDRQHAADLYLAKCASCHDAGMANAPRLGVAADWTDRLPRGRAALHAAALRGIPDSAMAAKGGYLELSDAEVVAIVDYMLTTLPAAPGRHARPAHRDPAPGAATPRLPEDEALAAVVSALRGEPRLPATAIKVRASAGTLVLEGVVDTSAQVRLAEQTAVRHAGAWRVQNKLIASDLFEWD